MLNTGHMKCVQNEFTLQNYMAQYINMSTQVLKFTSFIPHADFTLCEPSLTAVNILQR
jgi:hypothetical protein